MAETPRFVFGYAADRLAASAETSACARDKETPGFSRTTMEAKSREERSLNIASLARPRSTPIEAGAHRSSSIAGAVPRKRAGATPITVSGRRFTRMDLPTTFGSEPK